MKIKNSNNVNIMLQPVYLWWGVGDFCNLPPVN